MARPGIQVSRMPTMTRENSSRPMSSVPNGCAADGARNDWATALLGVVGDDQRPDDRQQREHDEEEQPGALEHAEARHALAQRATALPRPAGFDGGGDRDAHPATSAPRHARQQLARVVVGRRRHDLLGRPVLDEPPALHDQHPVGDEARGGEVVRDEQQGHAELAPQLAEEVEDRRRQRDVHAADRLVAEQEVGRDDDRARDRRPLLLTAGELRRQPARQRRRQPHALERGSRCAAPAPPPAARAAAGAREPGRRSSSTA